MKITGEPINIAGIPDDFIACEDDDVLMVQHKCGEVFIFGRGVEALTVIAAASEHLLLHETADELKLIEAEALKPFYQG